MLPFPAIGARFYHTLHSCVDGKLGVAILYHAQMHSGIYRYLLMGQMCHGQFWEKWTKSL